MVCWVSVLILINCKVPYDPTLKSTDTNSLVVEGYIDGNAPISFKLSRTRPLTTGDTAARVYESNANVSIEDDHQNTYPLMQMGNGLYSNSNILDLNPTYQYRLHVITSDGKEYASDFVPFKQSPNIDSITWGIKDGGVQVYVNTHDPNNATTYYRWEYNETWEFHSTYYSTIKYIAANDTIVPRTEQIYACWQSDNSTNIFLGSSAKLSSDVISQMPIAYIPPQDKKISVLYSILVQQFALDINGYNYWLAMKNNTESVGSIFDPQPNETVGNIHCITNPAETVVGYISAGNSVTSRTFISNSSMPMGWNQYPNCLKILVPINPDSLRYYFGSGYVPIVLTMTPQGAPAYSASYGGCVDCTLSGTNIKPNFWP